MEKESIIVPQVKEFAESISEVMKLANRPCGMLCIAAELVGGRAKVASISLGNIKFLVPFLARDIVRAAQGDGDAVLGIAVLAAIRELCNDKAKEIIQRMNEEGENDNG